MSINLRSKKVLAVGVAVIVLTGSAAYAFWTGGGLGTGTAPTASGTVALTVNQAALTEMYPGDSPQTIAGTLGNTNTAPVYVTSVTVSISSVSLAVGAVGTCTAADYTLADPVMAVGAQVLVGPAVGVWTGATIQFNNTAANQDACKSATVNLAYVVA